MTRDGGSKISKQTDHSKPPISLISFRHKPNFPNTSTKIVAITTTTTTATQRWTGSMCSRWFGSVWGRGWHGVVVEQPPWEEGPDCERHSQPVHQNCRHHRCHYHRHSKVDRWHVRSTVWIGVGAWPAWGCCHCRPAQKRLPGEDGGGDAGAGVAGGCRGLFKTRAMLQSSEEVGLFKSE
jgi:hypothetical protein